MNGCAVQVAAPTYSCARVRVAGPDFEFGLARKFFDPLLVETFSSVSAHRSVVMMTTTTIIMTKKMLKRF